MAQYTAARSILIDIAYDNLAMFKEVEMAKNCLRLAKTVDNLLLQNGKASTEAIEALEQVMAELTM